MTNMIKDGKVLTTEEKYSRYLRDRSDESIEYTINDANLARLAMPDGINAEFYAAEVRLCKAELQRREDIQWAEIESAMLGG